ncbi:PadR family transcriptional regulator [Tessaracoccus sp. OH4464_COT-324]|uniref:PadR family transcriptional regulator n=1 Tax=Tessaracoccus sp. OH4464_COT-324 TaxID=2491059 RepID=UPI000F644873|nr:helix-turn-helix transcriptional regulator [Tessaracoccus sp. OH4464_COT-324]RRD45910.1 PadR family transcriptional regulator [Tessaracoccus sp. OH4464_COT-324]
MSVKHALLALLAREQMSAYRLKKAFDASTNQTWPLNVGQVSTTLRRLERDGLVAEEGDVEPVRWVITPAGREELRAWWATPVVRLRESRDELVIKFALASADPGVDFRRLIARQRTATQGTLHDLTRALRTVSDDEQTARLVLLNHIFSCEAELRWLAALEASGARSKRSAGSRRADSPAAREAESQHAGA